MFPFQTAVHMTFHGPYVTLYVTFTISFIKGYERIRKSKRLGLEKIVALLDNKIVTPPEKLIKCLHDRGRSNSNTRIRLWLLFPHNQILYLYLFPFEILELL